MNCVWYGRHPSLSAVATCIFERVAHPGECLFTCESCFQSLRDNPFIKFTTDDPDIMACIEVLKS